LQDVDQVLDIELPQATHFNLCLSFKEFEIGKWDPEEEEKLGNLIINQNKIEEYRGQ
jgi:hypothetical protein